MTKARGELTVEIDGEEYVLRSTLLAIEWIDEKYGGLLNAFSRVDNDGSLSACASIVWAGISDAGTDKNAPRADAVLSEFNGRLVDAMLIAKRYLLLITTGEHGVFDLADEKEDASEDEGKSES